MKLRLSAANPGSGVITVLANARVLPLEENVRGSAERPGSDVPLGDTSPSDVVASDVLAGDIPVSDIPVSDIPVSDIVLRDGVIAAVLPAGAASTIPESAHAERRDLAGRFVVPGLWDAHVHFTQWAHTASRLDVGVAASAADAARLVAERAATAAETALGHAPLIGYGFHAAAPGRPVILISGDLHAAWLNRLALVEHGLAHHETGLLREEDAFTVLRRLDDVPDDVADAWAHDAARAASARGVVGIVDMEMAWNVDVWQRRIAGGNTQLRVEFGVYTQFLDRAIAEGLRSGQTIPHTHGLLRMGPYKVITDGSLNTRTAYCFAPYPEPMEGEGDHGALTIPPEQLEPLMTKAHRAGIRSAVHAIGDQANSLALDAFANTGAAGSIEHAQLLQQSDIRRFAELGVVASVQPEHAMDDRDVAEHHWAGHTERTFPLRDLLDAGATLALGSDAPVAPLDPWVAVSAAVHRSRAGREPWHPEQAITLEEALRASTRTRVAEGQPADLAILGGDPRSLDADALRNIRVDATLVNGRFTHDAL
jgi:predicted amidohydrolase YtcJ